MRRFLARLYPESLGRTGSNSPLSAADMGALFAQSGFQELGEGSTSIDVREHPDDALVLDYHRGPVLLLRHRRDDLVEGGLWSDGIELFRHRAVNGGRVGV